MKHEDQKVEAEACERAGPRLERIVNDPNTKWHPLDSDLKAKLEEWESQDPKDRVPFKKE